MPLIPLENGAKFIFAHKRLRGGGRQVQIRTTDTDGTWSFISKKKIRARTQIRRDTKLGKWTKVGKLNLDDEHEENMLIYSMNAENQKIPVYSLSFSDVPKNNQQGTPRMLQLGYFSVDLKHRDNYKWKAPNPWVGWEVPKYQKNKDFYPNLAVMAVPIKGNVLRNIASAKIGKEPTHGIR